MKRLTDPCENLRCYIMVHGGIDRHERLLDVEFIESLVRAANEVVASRAFMPETFNENIETLKGVLKDGHWQRG